MMQHRIARYFLLLISLLSASGAFGLGTDPRLLQLVPTQSRLVAGMSRSAGQGSTGSFLVITRENKIDLKDFFALTGGDPSHRLSALVFVSGADGDTGSNAHSLLASGQFNRESIFRIAPSGADRESYRGVGVLVIPPFEREREKFQETRWLAILDGQIAIFGSVESVRAEIDRWVEHAAPDRTVMDEFNGLKGNDDSWCLLLARDRQGIARSALERLDPKLAAVARDGWLLSFGIKFGRKIKVVAAADPFAGGDRTSPEDLEAAERAAAVHTFSFLPKEGTSRRAEVTISRSSYEKWIEETAPRDAFLSGPAKQ